MSWAEPAAWTPVAEAVLAGLATDCDQWMVLKHHERLPEVTGDIDLCVPREDWARVFEVIASALAEIGEFGITWCEHWANARLMFIVPLRAGDAPTRLLQIDFIDGVLWRGVQLAPATRVLADHRVDVTTVSAVPPHPSAALRAALFLTAYALRASGRLSDDVIAAKGIGTLARSDPDRFIEAMTLCHGRLGARSAQRFLDDRWPIHLGLALQARRLLRFPIDHVNLAAMWIERRRVRHWRGVSRDLPGGVRDWKAIHARGHQTSWTKRAERAAAIGSPR